MNWCLEKSLDIFNGKEQFFNYHVKNLKLLNNLSVFCTNPKLQLSTKIFIKIISVEKFSDSA